MTTQTKLSAELQPDDFGGDTFDSVAASDSINRSILQPLYKVLNQVPRFAVVTLSLQMQSGLFPFPLQTLPFQPIAILVGQLLDITNTVLAPIGAAPYVEWSIASDGSVLLTGAPLTNAHNYRLVLVLLG